MSINASISINYINVSPVSREIMGSPDVPTVSCMSDVSKAQVSKCLDGWGYTEIAGVKETVSVMGNIDAKTHRRCFKVHKWVGPSNCLRSAQAPADWQTCGARMVTVRHTPIMIAGSFCCACCPCCKAPVQAAPSIPSGKAGTT